MIKRYKSYLRLNIVSIFFVVVSFISVTLAWFAYSGLSRVSTEIGVKAWYIELSRNGEKVSNNVVISLDEIYPGMETVTERINIKNLGDSDAQLKYSLVSARILDNEDDEYIINDDPAESERVEDLLAHNYPFHVNISLSQSYVLTETENYFEVSVSWPLDSDDDAVDSSWGTNAYLFQQSEISKKNEDETYQIKSSIQITINLMAEQYLEEDDSSDFKYNKGDVVLFDVVNNEKCSELGPTCIQTYVIDKNNTLGDDTVTLMPNPMDTYLSATYSDYNSLLSSTTNGWAVGTRALTVEDILKIISTDIVNSVLVIENISDAIIGNLNYPGRINTELSKAINYGGYYRYNNEKFNYLSSVNCYWTSSEYNSNRVFAVKKINDTNSKIYGELKSSECNIIPVIITDKSSLL